MFLLPDTIPTYTFTSRIESTETGASKPLPPVRKMSLLLQKPTRVSARLEAPDNIVLDLKNGLSGHIYFCVRNDEDKAVTLTIHRQLCDAEIRFHGSA